jgi:hypothetical protein
MSIFYWDIQQGSLAWHQLRSGVPTASQFHRIITPAKMQISEQRKGYACQLIAERLLKWQPETLDHVKHIEDGRANEPEAVKQLEFTLGVDTKSVGFVTTDDGRFGASPDRVMGGPSVDTILEVKSPTPPVQVRRLIFGNGDDYRCQVNGELYVAEADKALYYSHHPRMPEFLLETGRDEVFIGKLAAALEQFSDELEAWTEKARRLGSWEAFQEVISPTEATYGGPHRGPGTAEELAKILEEGL